MIEEELMKIWQSSCNQELIKFEKSKLMIELQSSLGNLHHWWKNIELVNFISALITIPLFLLFAFRAPFISMKIASVLIVIWAAYVGVRLFGIKKLKPNEQEGNYLQYLEKTRIYLLAQKKMLETSLNWAILTIYPIYILFFIGIWERPLARYIGGLSFMVLIAIGIYEYYRSKKRVRNQINPRISQVDELMKELKSENSFNMGL